MSSTGRPPDLSGSSLVRLIHHLYSFCFIDEQSLKQLDSYDDRNYYFSGTLEDGETSGFVFKMYNCLNNLPDVVCGVSALMKHLHSRGFLGTSQVSLTDKDKSSSIGMVTGREVRRVVGVDCDVMDEYTYCVRTVRYVPGEMMENISKECVTPKLLFEAGQFLGKIDTALSDGFTNKAISTRVLANFDQMHFLNTFPDFISSVDDPNRQKMAEQVFAEYSKHMAPNIPTFKKGILHHDAHTSNIVVRGSPQEEYKVVAFIDYDDSVDSCYLFELAVFVIDVIAENFDHPNPIELVTPLISGYLHEFDVIKEEINHLYYAVMARCCMSAMVSELQYKNEPWNDYILSSIEPRWKVMELFLKTNKADVDRLWSKAVGKTLENFVS